MTTLRIGFLSSAYEMSGSYFRVFFLGKYLAKKGHTVTLVVTSRQMNPKIVVKSIDGVTVFTLPSLTWATSNRMSNWLSRMLTSSAQTLLNPIWEITSDIDILHSFDVMFPQNALATVSRKALNSLGGHGHSLFVDWDDWWGRGGLISLYGGLWSLIDVFGTFLEEKVPLYARAVTVINETLRQRALRVGVNPEDLFVIPNGCNIDFIKPIDASVARQQLGLPMKNQICTQIGNLDLTSLKLLLAAHTKVLKRHPNVFLMLVGLSKDRINFVKSSGMSRNVICLEWQSYSKIPLYLGASDIFLLPMEDNIANRAAWPLRLGDYLAAGRPTVAVDFPEIRKIVQRCGLLADPTNPEDWVSKILELLPDQNRRIEMGRRARELAETKYSWQNIARQLEEVYHRYL